MRWKSTICGRRTDRSDLGGCVDASVKKYKRYGIKISEEKYKSKGFAAGCSREVIERGAKQLGWELEKLLTMTLQAMAASEDTIRAEMEEEQE